MDLNPEFYKPWHRPRTMCGRFSPPENVLRLPALSGPRGLQGSTHRPPEQGVPLALQAVLVGGL